MLFGKKKLTQLRKACEISASGLINEINGLRKEAERTKSQIREARTARKNLSTRITKLETEIVELKGRKKKERW